MPTHIPCAWCGRPCAADTVPLCLACSLLAETEETDDTERWNYPEAHWEETP